MTDLNTASTTDTTEYTAETLTKMVEALQAVQSISEHFRMRGFGSRPAVTEEARRDYMALEASMHAWCIAATNHLSPATENDG